MHIKVFDLIFRYDGAITYEYLKEDLERDKRWTVMEFGYLLRYLSTEERKLKKSSQEGEEAK